MSYHSRTFAVIGLGAFGSTLASELARFGDRVIGIDRDEKRVARLANVLPEVMIADGTDEHALREAGVGDYDVAVVAIGEDLEANILCTMNAKLVGVKEVWAKALHRTHHRILAKIGADRVILPEHEMGQHVAQILHTPMVRDFVSLGNGFHVVTLNIPGRLAGRTLRSLKLAEKFELRPLGLMRSGQFVPCETADTALEEHDRLLVLGRRQALRKFADSV